MRYLKLVPFFVSVVLYNASPVCAVPRPLDQSKVIGDMTLGLVAPTAVPNPQTPDLPNVGGGGTSLPPGVPNAAGVPGSGGTSALSSIPGFKGASKLSGILSGLPGLSALSSLGQAPKVPTRRSPDPGHGNARLQPRQFHNADFSANPNGTIPQAPSPTHSDAPAVAAKRGMEAMHVGYVVPTSTATGPKHEDIEATRPSNKKRATKSQGRPSRPSKKKSTSSSPERPTHPEHKQNSPAGPGQGADGQSSTSPSSGPAAGFADILKTISAAPNELSPAVNSMPATPNTPLTTADTQPGIDAADTTDVEAAPKVPVPIEEKEPAPAANAGAYPNAPGYSQTPAAAEAASVSAKSKRHSFVLDTDPLLTPSAETAEKKDPKMGLLNVDSNEKPSSPPQLPLSASKPAVTPKPTSTDAAPTSSVSLYQPSEPGYQPATYPTPTPV